MDNYQDSKKLPSPNLGFAYIITFQSWHLTHWGTHKWEDNVRLPSVQLDDWEDLVKKKSLTRQYPFISLYKELSWHDLEDQYNKNNTERMSGSQELTLTLFAQESPWRASPR